MLEIKLGVNLEVKLGVESIGFPKVHGRIRIGLPKVHGQIRIGLPKVHGRFRIGPPQVSNAITEVWPGKAQPAYGRNQVVVGIAQ